MGSQKTTTTNASRMCDFNAYIGSCGEYIAICKNPIAFYGGGFGAMAKCDQSDWVKHFSAWSAMQVIAGILTALGYLIGWAAYGWFGSGISWFIRLSIQAYLNGHLFWFIVTKANCCNVPILYLVASICCCVNGLSGFFGSFGYLAYSVAFIVAMIFSLLHSVSTIEMGIALFKLWKGAGKTGAASLPTPAEPAAPAPVADATPVEAAEAKTAEP